MSVGEYTPKQEELSSEQQTIALADFFNNLADFRRFHRRVRFDTYEFTDDILVLQDATDTLVRSYDTLVSAYGGVDAAKEVLKNIK